MTHPLFDTTGPTNADLARWRRDLRRLLELCEAGRPSARKGVPTGGREPEPSGMLSALREELRSELSSITRSVPLVDLDEELEALLLWEIHLSSDSHSIPSTRTLFIKRCLTDGYISDLGTPSLNWVKGRMYLQVMGATAPSHPRKAAWPGIERVMAALHRADDYAGTSSAAMATWLRVQALSDSGRGLDDDEVADLLQQQLDAFISDAVAGGSDRGELVRSMRVIQDDYWFAVECDTSLSVALPSLEELPRRLRVEGDLYLWAPELKVLPEHLSVNGSLRINSDEIRFRDDGEVRATSLRIEGRVADGVIRGVVRLAGDLDVQSSTARRLSGSVSVGGRIITTRRNGLLHKQGLAHQAIQTWTEDGPETILVEIPLDREPDDPRNVPAIADMQRRVRERKSDELREYEG